MDNNPSLAPAGNVVRDPAQKEIVGDEVQNSVNPLYLGEKTNSIVTPPTDKTGGVFIKQKHYFDMQPITEENAKVNAHGTQVFATAMAEVRKNDISLPMMSDGQNLKYIRGINNM